MSFVQTTLRDLRCRTDLSANSKRAHQAWPTLHQAHCAEGQVEQARCFGLTHSQIVKKVRDWEVRSGNPNLLTVPRLACSDNNASAGPVEATAAAYNDNAFECYLCRREFGSLVSLNQHLNSGAHYSKEFKCKKCGFTTTWFSGLIAHIESEKCGFMTRSQVQDLATPLAQFRIGN